MQAKVIFPFPQNATYRHRVGSVIEVDQKKYNRLLRTGFVSPLETATVSYSEKATEKRFENSTQSPDEYRGRHKNRR
jgi:hypothetical protein